MESVAVVGGSDEEGDQDAGKKCKDLGPFGGPSVSERHSRWETGFFCAAG